MDWSSFWLFLATGIASLAFIILLVYFMGWIGGEIKGRTVVKAAAILIPVTVIAWSIAGALGVLQ
jgi:uncharacterized membrane protein (DUF485 family)